jgi:signal transduction histidine kinase
VIGIALAVGAGTLVAGTLGALAATRLPSLAAQIAAQSLIVAVLPIVAVILAGAAMFDSAHDVTILVIAATASLTAVVGAALLARSMSRRMGRLREASTAMAGGDLSARAPEDGPRELSEVARSFNEMADRLEELFDARRHLVAWASHDLRTPVASLRAMIEAVDDGVAPPEQYIPVMAEQVASLSTLIDDLFELARIDAGALALRVDEAPIGALVSSCLRGVQAEADARGVHLEARLADPGLIAQCSPESVERVLYNLLRNAIRHTPDDGGVAVLVDPAADAVIVAVEDSGEGFPEGTERRAFDRFWRGDPARTDDGAGLGLAIARGLVEAQGGRIWAERAPRGGARVCFTIPRGRIPTAAALS